MGKVRTKSRFYTHDSNTIGDVTEIGSGLIDVSNISLNAVNNKINPLVIGAAGLTTTVNNSNVNKWAAFRPYPTTYNNTYGWGYNSSTNQLILYTGNNDAQKRLGDFAGYNHTAQPSRLLHNPASGIVGQNYTTTNNIEFGPNITIQFKYEEISPSELFTTGFNDSYMRVHLGTTTGGSVLGSANVSTSISNGIVSITVPKGFALYGSRTFSVWFGNEFTSQERWRFGSEILNDFTLTVKTYFDYVFSTVNMGANFFNITVNSENNAFNQIPETSTTTLNFSTNLLLGFGDTIGIDVSQDGNTWTQYDSLSSIPSTYTINWITAFGNNAHRNEDDRYYVRVTYFSVFGK